MCQQDLTVRNESPGNDKVVDSEARNRKIRSITAQVLASTAKNILLFSCGLFLGFPTIVIPSVHNAPANATLTLTDEEVSWFGSISSIANPIGCVGSGIISSTFGRKRSMQVYTIPILASWIILYYAHSAPMLIAGAALAGLSGGLLEGPVLTYVSEITEPYLRGMMAATTTLSILFGILIEYIMGSLIEWRTLCIINPAGPIVSFFVLFFIPESPYWLLSKNRFEDAQNSLCWLRGWTTNEHIQEEFDQLVTKIHPELKTTNKYNDYANERKNRFWTFNIKNYLKRTSVHPFLLILFTSVIIHFTGITSFIPYAINIFNSYGSPISPYYATIIFGLSRFLGPLACICLIHRTGKRPLVFASVAGMGIVYGAAGLYGYFYLGLEKMDNGALVREHFHGTPKYSWLPMACFMAAPFLGYVGVRLLAWHLIGESYPTEIRSSMSGFSAGLCYFMGFVAVKTFFDFVSVFTLSGTFIFYALVSFVSLVVFYFWLPETEGWTLAEVEEHFAGKRNLIKAGRKKKKNSADLQGLDNPVAITDEAT